MDMNEAEYLSNRFAYETAKPWRMIDFYLDSEMVISVSSDNIGRAVIGMMFQDAIIWNSYIVR